MCVDELIGWRGFEDVDPRGYFDECGRSLEQFFFLHHAVA
jgi:hypothetical protein